MTNPPNSRTLLKSTHSHCAPPAAERHAVSARPSMARSGVCPSIELDAVTSGADASTGSSSKLIRSTQTLPLPPVAAVTVTSIAPIFVST